MADVKEDVKRHAKEVVKVDATRVVQLLVIGHAKVVAKEPVEVVVPEEMRLIWRNRNLL